MMTDECVVAVYKNLAYAQGAVRKLADNAFPTSQVSLVTAGLKDHPELVKELELSDDALHDAALTAELGGVLGMLSGLGALVVSGLGAVFLVGPVGGAIAGGVTGGFIGAMAGAGIHEHKIRHYEGLIETGHVLLIVNGDPLELVRAHRLLEDDGVVELHTYSRSED